jgi:adenylate cyclase
VVGSTDLVQRDETLAHQRLTGAFDRLSAQIDAYGGVVREVRGDALVAEFSRASDAVCAALAFQQANQEHNAAIDDGLTPAVRVGLGMGEVVVADDTVTGAGVVLAQRVEQLAKAGGVCIQGAAFETVPRRFPIHFQSLGEQRLKGFPDPVRVYAAALEDGVEVPAPEPVSVLVRLRRSRRALQPVGLFVAIVAGASLAGWWWSTSSGRDPAEPHGVVIGERPTVAVLPFDNLSRDPEQEYFSDGITIDLINSLARFSSLVVIARNSVFAFKGRPTNLQTISRELGARYILEGSVQKAGDRVRVNVQFLDALSGRQSWAQRFDEAFTDALDLQEGIANHIARTLSIRVTELERRRLSARPTDDFNAYDEVLQGRALLDRLTRRENFAARGHFRKAIELDPNYADAYSGLGWSYLNAIAYGWMGAADVGMAKTEQLARKAIELNPEAVDGYRLLGQLYTNLGENDRAVVTLERAIAINPNDAESYARQGQAFVYSGRVEAAVRSLETALRIDPNMSPEALMHLGMAYYHNQRFPDALNWLHRAVDRNPDNVFIHMYLAATYGQLGQSEAAAAAASAVLRLDPFFRTDNPGFGSNYADREAVKHVVDGLHKAGLE